VEKIGVSKKFKKLIKSRKLEKNNPKNRTVKKNLLNRLEFWKNRSVRFWFYKRETKKTEPNPNRKKSEKKPSQIGLNQFKCWVVTNHKPSNFSGPQQYFTQTISEKSSKSIFKKEGLICLECYLFILWFIYFFCLIDNFFKKISGIILYL
jgi:hypothetical protein